VSIALSVLLHGALLAALVYGWLLFRRPPPPKPTLAIEATVVDARTVRGAAQPPAPQPPAPPVPAPTPEEPSGPPQPTPEELVQREQQRKRAQEAAEEQRRAAEQKAAAAAAQAKQGEEQRRVEEQRRAEARAVAERKARAAAEAQKRAAQALEQSAREELQRSLAAEEHAAAARSGPALANYLALIAAKINRVWLRPPTARQGIECVLHVTQAPGGQVTQVSIGECNGDQAVRQSLEDAVYRASPLPPPPDPALFDRNLRIDFKPD